MNHSSSFLEVDWPAPKNIGAIHTSRQNGVSLPPYDSFNLATHVGDAPNLVEQNRQVLLSKNNLEEVCWLNQVHGTDVVHAKTGMSPVDADASWTETTDFACAVLVADCMPVLVTNISGTKVGCAHAGWRGLAQGVIANLLQSMSLQPKDTLVWLGPTISQSAFEVGSDVLSDFEKSDYFQGIDVLSAFKLGSGDRLHADLYALAKMQLNALGVNQIYGGNFCTYKESDRFFSYRRDGVTGRMASLIWIKD